MNSVVKYPFLHLQSSRVGCCSPMRDSFYYPPQAIFDPYRRIYRAGSILFVYNDASVPWIISVNNFRFFTHILEIMQLTNTYYISLERSFHSASARLCCIKIQTEMDEKSQIKYLGFYIH